MKNHLQNVYLLILTVRNTWETADDYSNFIKWIIDTTIEHYPTVEWDEEATIHIGRIALFFYKFFKLPFSGNDEEIFQETIVDKRTNQQSSKIIYSKNYKEKVEESTAKDKRTKKETVESATAKEKRTRKMTKKDTDDQGNSQNTNDTNHSVLYNLVANTKRDNRDTTNFMGGAIVTRSQLFCDSMHGQEYATIFEKKGQFNFACMPAHPVLFATTTGIEKREIASTYARYVLFEPDDKAATLANTTPSDSLETHLLKSASPDLFCGLYIEENEKTGLSSVELPSIEIDKECLYIASGGGPFVELIADVSRVLHAISIPFQFICVALQEGSHEIVPTINKFPFEGLTESEFKKLKFSPSNMLTKIKRKILFLLQGDDEIYPNSFNLLLHTYFSHLLQDAAGENFPSDRAVAQGELDNWNFKDQTLGMLLKESIDSLVFIYKEKVF